ncbi:hypothetical protein [Amycolatopsis sp. NBC_00438]|uniref:hypothetical protein n=1 Tax=Amycolatopsis sp. NBC_00438 TaxID=2903558 RepID=UPI002E24F74F
MRKTLVRLAFLPRLATVQPALEWTTPSPDYGLAPSPTAGARRRPGPAGVPLVQNLRARDAGGVRFPGAAGDRRRRRARGVHPGERLWRPSGSGLSA